jgi:phosphoribosylformimino-5-aminoimidazole carboxamide ribotide isomerase
MAFEVVPSIDLIDGEVVRVERGDVKAKTVFSDDPVETATDWESQGAPRLHIVDLDAATTGKPRHQDVVEEIVKALDIPVQVAGGIRSIELAKGWLEAGADRVVIGTKALTDEEFLASAVEELGEGLVVAPDTRGGTVRVAGWKESTGEDVVDAVQRLVAAGVPRLLVTDIAQDGMLAGPNTDLMDELTAAVEVPILASGGVSSIDDLQALAEIEGIEGAIVGKALYVGAFELADAVRMVTA